MEEEFKDTKGVIKIRISKNRKHNDQKKKYKRTDLYNLPELTLNKLRSGL
jgi:hypothetical protein